MSGLLLAFSFVWAGTTAYVGWMGIRQRRLSEQLRALHERLESQSSREHAKSKAA